ncbi:MAG TPA: glycosyltransferase [Anaerolineaceae bacterium]|nr:glycosyltransferase [Anaerolineaceae bacterium]
MSQPIHKPARVLFLFSDTGGGHRSASEAIIESLKLEYGGRIEMEMVDIFKDYAPPPFSYSPEIYPRMAYFPEVWRFGYNLSNGNRQARAVTALLLPYLRRSARRLIREHPAELIVSVHPLANGTFLRVLGERHTPFITVVTDMVTTHALWYHYKADKVLVPTPVALERGLTYGLSMQQLEVVGLPVAQRFTQPPGNKAELREKLGWPQGCPVVLLVGGGEGMGPVERTAHAIDASGLKLALMMIAGRNRGLQDRLEGYAWRGPAKVYGFVHEMPDFMRAADVLVTKAGPGTISESFIAGLPMILFSRMPGQEDGNVAYVVNEGAGVWAPHAEQVVATLRNWLEHPERMERTATACKRLARPDSSRQIARIIAETLGISTPTRSEA